jgi:hypothetical protein
MWEGTGYSYSRFGRNEMEEEGSKERTRLTMQTDIEAILRQQSQSIAWAAKRLLRGFHSSGIQPGGKRASQGKRDMFGSSQPNWR